MQWVLLFAHAIVIVLGAYLHFRKKRIITPDIYIVCLVQTILKLSREQYSFTEVQIYLFLPMALFYIYFGLVMIKSLGIKSEKVN